LEVVDYQTVSLNDKNQGAPFGRHGLHDLRRGRHIAAKPEKGNWNLIWGNAPYIKSSLEFKNLHG
jgi:hypothetical protein